ncbi:MAG TPA: nickel ABC transporter permease [Limnochordales bacterium]|nr:nickel ABC transporter permease [Limnochordales bacterium]
MARYVLQRLLSAVVVLWGVTVLVFSMVHATPGDPVRVLLGDSARGATAEDLARLRSELGLDQPLLVQYKNFLAGLLQGDLGKSWRTNRPVAAEIAERLPYTLQLTVAALLVAVLIGLPAGVLAATRPYSSVDYALTGLALVGVSMPVFWLGLLLMMVFALTLGWFPASGSGTWRHLVLPALTVGAASTAFIARMTRAAMLEVLTEDYVRTARAKGLSEWAVVGKHALRNAAAPILTAIGLQFGGLMGGAVLTETVFAWPGLGRLVVNAILTRDLYMLQGSILFTAFLFIVVNLLVDIGYSLLNPKVRFA